MWPQFQTVEFGQPAVDLRALGAMQGAVNFGAVAGGEDDRFVNAGALGQTAQRSDHDIRTESDAFAHINRRRFVIETDREQCHFSDNKASWDLKFCIIKGLNSSFAS